jgi:hypothetical protein
VRACYTQKEATWIKELLQCPSAWNDEKQARVVQPGASRELSSLLGWEAESAFTAFASSGISN